MWPKESLVEVSSAIGQPVLSDPPDPLTQRLGLKKVVGRDVRGRVVCLTTQVGLWVKVDEDRDRAVMVDPDVNGKRKLTPLRPWAPRPSGGQSSRAVDTR